MPSPTEFMRRRQPSATNQGRSRIDDFMTSRTNADEEDEDPFLEDDSDDDATWLDTGITTALRVVPSIVGGVAGSAVAPVAGTIVGGGAGAALGETAAQGYEAWRGLRKRISPGSIATETALGAIPLGKSARLASAALKGAGLNVAGTVGHSLSERGELPSLEEAGTSAVLGSAFGGGAHSLANRLAARRAARLAPPVDDLPTPPPSPLRDPLDALDIPVVGDEPYIRPPSPGEPRLSQPQLQDELDEAWSARVADPLAPKSPSEFMRIRHMAPESQAAMEAIPPTAPETLAPPRLVESEAPPLPSWERVDPRRALPEEVAMQEQIPTRLLPPESPSAFMRRNRQGLEELGDVRGPLSPRGERGGVAPELAARLGGAAAGGATGGTIGAASVDEDASTEERLQAILGGAAVGAAGGAAAPSMLRRLMTPRAAAESPIASARARGITQPQIEEAIEGVTRAQEGPSVKTATGRASGEVPVLRFVGEKGPVPPRGQMPEAQRTEFLNVNKFGKEFQQPLRELGDQIGEEVLEQQRRGTQSWARTNALAEALTLDAGRSLKPGTALNAEQLRSYHLGVASMMEKSRELARRYADEPTDEIGLELQRANASLTALIKSASGARSEAGRSLQVLRQLNTIQPAELRLAQEYQKRGRLRGDMSQLAEVLGQLPEDPTEAVKALGKMQSSGLLDKATSYYMSNILSGVQTYNRNLLGNIMNTLSGSVIKGTAGAGFDALKSLLGGKPRQVYAREALHEATGAAYATTSAMRDAFDVLRQGFSTRALEEGLAGGDLYIPKQEFAGGAANPFNMPGRLLEATDRFFGTLNKNADLYGQAYSVARREAEQRRLSGQRFVNYVSERSTELRAAPTPEMSGRAQRAGEYATFREDPDKFTGWLMGLQRQVPMSRFIIPFVKTPGNIFRQGLEHTPAGFFMKGAQSADPREAAIAQGRAAFGAVTLLPIAYLAGTGRISGYGPKDSAERASLLEQGWRPNSIKLKLPDSMASTLGASRSPDGEYWVNYSLFQPMSVPMALVANMAEAYRNAQTQSTEADIAEQVMDAGFRVANTAFSQTYMQGVFNLVNAIEDPERGGMKFVKALARGAVPMSGLMSSVTKAVDPVMRETTSVPEEMQSIVPGLSQKLRPRLDRFGRPIERTGTPLRRAAAVPEIEPAKTDKIASELDRLKIRVGLPSDRVDLGDKRRGVKGRKLTDEESHLLRETRGQSTRAALARVILSPGYDRLPDAIKRERIEGARERAARNTSEVTRMGLSRNRPDLIERLRARAKRDLERSEGRR